MRKHNSRIVSPQTDRGIDRFENLAESCLLSDAKHLNPQYHDDFEELKSHLAQVATENEHLPSSATHTVEADDEVDPPEKLVKVSCQEWTASSALASAVSSADDEYTARDMTDSLPAASWKGTSILGFMENDDPGSLKGVTIPTRILRSLSTFFRAQPADISSFVYTFSCFAEKEVRWVGNWICGFYTIAHLRDLSVVMQLKISIIASLLELRALQVQALYCLRQVLVDQGSFLTCSSVDYVWIVSKEDDPVRQVLLQSMYIQGVALKKLETMTNDLWSKAEVSRLAKLFRSALFKQDSDYTNWWDSFLAFLESRCDTTLLGRTRTSQDKWWPKVCSLFKEAPLKDSEVKQLHDSFVELRANRALLHEQYLHIPISDTPEDNNLGRMCKALVRAECVPAAFLGELNVPCLEDDTIVPATVQPLSAGSMLLPDVQSVQAGRDGASATLATASAQTAHNAQQVNIGRQTVAAQQLVDACERIRNAGAQTIMRLKTLPDSFPQATDVSAHEEALGQRDESGSTQGPVAVDDRSHDDHSQGDAVLSQDVVETEATAPTAVLPAPSPPAEAHKTLPDPKKGIKRRTYPLSLTSKKSNKRSKQDTIVVTLKDGKVSVDKQELIGVSAVAKELHEQQGDSFKGIPKLNATCEQFNHFVRCIAMPETPEWSKKSLIDKITIAAVASQVRAVEIVQTAVQEAHIHVSKFGMEPAVVDKVYAEVAMTPELARHVVEMLGRRLKSQGVNDLEDASKLLKNEEAVRTLGYFWANITLAERG